jgi:hypothetical protein
MFFSCWISERSSVVYFITCNQFFWYQPVISKYSAISMILAMDFYIFDDVLYIPNVGYLVQVTWNA